MATWVAGFEDETLRDLWRGFRQLIAYDPDQIQALYVTPHRWTPFFRIAADLKVIQKDVRLWDYKHQVLQMTRLRPWMLFFAVKLIEVVVQSRPKALARILFHPDPEQRESHRPGAEGRPEEGPDLRGHGGGGMDRQERQPEREPEHQRRHRSDPPLRLGGHAASAGASRTRRSA